MKTKAYLAIHCLKDYDLSIGRLLLNFTFIKGPSRKLRLNCSAPKAQ